MPSFADSAVIFILALLLFGPKKLPVLARELGKWIGEFRRASNEFKMQMEEELRMSEQADRQKELAAIEAAAPAAPALDGVPTEDPVHPHIDRYDESYDNSFAAPAETTSADTTSVDTTSEATLYPEADTAAAEPAAPLPIATSGDLSIMPPSTGLPVPQSRPDRNPDRGSDGLGSFIDSIPVADPPHSTDLHAEPTA